MENKYSRLLDRLPPPVFFTGEFTPEMREQFRMKRLTLGVSFQQLGELLHINWSTIRKWEDGQTRICHTRHVARVARFLNGGYDLQLTTMIEPTDDMLNLWNHLPKSMHVCLERAATIYGLCNNYPELCDQLLGNMSDAINNTIHCLLKRSELS